MDLPSLLVFVLLLYELEFVLPSKFCEKNPKLIQCVALKNQFLLPKHSSCNPFTKKPNCQIGDLVSPAVARCESKFSGNIKSSLLYDYRESSFQRCFPALQSPDDLRKRNIAFSRGEPGCKPVVLSRKATFTCGEMGTRCVCDAPAGVTKWLKNKCRCQWFVNLCKIPRLCVHPNAQCRTRGSQVQCRCPPDSKDCRPGINQCRGNPTLCEDQQGKCIELYDTNPEWGLGNEKEGQGYACVMHSIVKALGTTTYYCDIASPSLQITRVRRPKNDLDLCCYRMFTCAGGVSYPKKGNIFSYRYCYCFIEFRKCLYPLYKNPKYRNKVETMLHVLDKISHCEMDDGKRCDPTRPWTCRKGDLIRPNLAHCKIDCATGPLLPIYLRACAIRQCKVPFQEKAATRIVDVPQNDKSSLCRPVKNLPVRCGDFGTDTRCVCDGKPTGSYFTDHCRCQFWPSRWDKKYTRTPPTAHTRGNSITSKSKSNIPP